MDCGLRKWDAYSFHLEQILHGIFRGATSVGAGTKLGLLQFIKTWLAGLAVRKAFCKFLIERYFVVFKVAGAVYSSWECGVGGSALQKLFFLCMHTKQGCAAPCTTLLGQLKSDSDLKTVRHRGCQCKTEMQDYTKANKDMHQSVVT